MKRDRLAFLTGLANRYGDLAEFRLGPRRFFLLSHPRLVRQALGERSSSLRKGLGLREAAPLFGEGLLTSEGSEWKRERETLQPCFSAGAIDGLAPLICREIAAWLDTWEASGCDGRPVDLVAAMSQVTFRVAARALFGVDLGGSYHEIACALTRALVASSDAIGVGWRIQDGPRRRLDAAVRELHGVADRIVAERRSLPPGGDLLSVLLRHHRHGEADSHMRDEIVTFLLIGHETTACALAWTWYELLEHPVVMAEVAAESRRVGADGLGHADGLRHLAFTRRVVEEAMRLHPPVWLISRETTRDEEIDGVAMPRGAGVLVSPYVIHRRAEFWRAPEAFDPSRFESAAIATRTPLTYLPFGAGPRACLGAGFAMTEAVAILAAILARYRVDRAPGPRVRAKPLLTLRLDPALHALVRARTR